MNVAAFCVLAMSTLGASPRGYVLEFSSQSCGPCQQVAPVVAKLEREGLPIRSVDVNTERDLAERYNVSSIPTFILVVDDQEVERMSSVQSESRIRQMLARIPQPKRTANDSLAVDLGKSAPVPRPEVTVLAEPRQPSKGMNVVQEQVEIPNRRWPFKTPTPAAPPANVRGNNPEPMSDLKSLVSSPLTPLKSSVRIRVMTGNSLVKGSGTLVESVAGRATILTCSHICRGATEATKVEVDLFRDGKMETILGKIVGTDPDADVGLISIPCDELWPTSPLGLLTQSPTVGSKVVSIGCGGGADPSQEQLRITEVNKFSGPDTLICSGIPVQGRSGGGLFDEHGTLVGVCFAADSDSQKRPNGGVYCGLKPIHELLAKHELAHLIPRNAEEELLANESPPAPAWPGEISSGGAKRGPDASPAKPFTDLLSESPQTSFARTPPTKTEPLAGTPPVEEFAADDAEVVVVIRSRNAGSAGDKVILIHKPSRKFLQFVQGEVSGDLGESTPVTRKSSSPTVEALTNRVARVKPSTKSLVPTGLETQREPQPFVRTIR